MERKKLTIVYRPAFAAAKFILDGVNLPEVDTLPIQFRKSRFCNVLYSLLSHLHLYSPAFFFRYERNFRKALTAAKGKVLFLGLLRCAGIQNSGFCIGKGMHSEHFLLESGFALVSERSEGPEGTFVFDETLSPFFL